MAGRHFGRSAAPLALLLLTVFCGCDHGPKRNYIYGRVTVDGQPLDFGSITFVPDPTGPKASGIIEQGRYQIEAARGPLAGGKFVEIRAPRFPADEPIPTTKTDKMRQLAVAPEALPQRYNAKTELRVSVTDDGPNEFNFELQSE